MFGKGGVRYRLPEGDGGPIEIRIDYGLVAPPPSYFYADVLGLRVDRPLLMVVLSFGRRSQSGDKISERIDIVMPEEALFQGFWKSTRNVEEVVDKILGQLRKQPPERRLTMGEEPAITLFANNIFVAVGNSETSLDFYHLSPRDVHLAKTRRYDISMQPIARIIMSTLLVKTFFRLLEPYVQQPSASKGLEEKIERATVAH